MAVILSFELNSLTGVFSPDTPVKFTGGFLIFNTVAIALMWLSQIVPPLIDGTIYPKGLDHYTTLIVQGLDLGLLLPAGFVIALLMIRKKPLGLLMGPVYFVFLSILMTALVAKLTGMAITGVSVVPAIFIIPLFNVLAITCSFLLIGNVLKR